MGLKLTFSRFDAKQFLVQRNGVMPDSRSLLRIPY